MTTGHFVRGDVVFGQPRYRVLELNFDAGTALIGEGGEHQHSCWQVWLVTFNEGETIVVESTRRPSRREVSAPWTSWKIDYVRRAVWVWAADLKKYLTTLLAVVDAKDPTGHLVTVRVGASGVSLVSHGEGLRASAQVGPVGETTPNAGFGTVVVHAPVLKLALAQLDSQVAVAVDDRSLLLGRVRVWTVAVDPVDEPIVPRAIRKLPAEPIRRALEFASHDKNRTMLNSVHLRGSALGELRVEAMDGSNLYAEDIEGVWFECDWLIPRAMVSKAVGRKAKLVEVAWDPATSQGLVRCPDAVIRCPSSIYPKTELFLRVSNGSPTIVLDRNEVDKLLDYLEQVAPLVGFSTTTSDLRARQLCHNGAPILEEKEGIWQGVSLASTDWVVHNTSALTRALNVLEDTVVEIYEDKGHAWLLQSLLPSGPRRVVVCFSGVKYNGQTMDA